MFSVVHLADENVHKLRMYVLFLLNWFSSSTDNEETFFTSSVYVIYECDANVSSTSTTHIHTSPIYV